MTAPPLAAAPVMPPPDAAVDHYLDQRALVAGAVAQATGLWDVVDVAAIDESWFDSRLATRLFVLVALAQLVAASEADTYISRVLDELGIDSARRAAVNPKGFAGVTSDGRSLETLLYEPVIATKSAVARGAREDAARHGLHSLVRIVATQVQDAGRSAVAAGIAARPAVTGWVRMLNPPSCARCAVLAGRAYRWNDGFDRHPLCDCRHIPTTETVVGDVMTSPTTYFESLGTAAQDRYFTKPGAAAIREGADIAQVVNARRGMTAAGTTLEGTSRRGAFTRLAGAPGARLMPERILAAATSRGEAIELLRQHGYLT